MGAFVTEPIPHKTRVKIVEKHVFPETLKSAKSIWGRELKLLKQLTAGRYEDSEFWLTLGLGFQLHSFAWFKTPEGQAALERAWRLHQFAKAQEATATLHNTLDKDSNSVSMESNGQVECAAAGQQVTRKMSPVEWADSIETQAS